MSDRLAGHPEFVQVRWLDLVAVLDDPDSPARYRLNDAMAEAWAEHIKPIIASAEESEPTIG